MIQFPELDKYETVKFKSTRKRVNDGDMFAIKFINPDIYFYGRMIKKEVNFSSLFFRGADYVHLYKNYSKDFNPPKKNELKFYKALILIRKGWNNGCYLRAGNIPVDEEDLKIDCGFEISGCGKGLFEKDYFSKEQLDDLKHNHEIITTSDDKLLITGYMDYNEKILDHIPKYIFPFVLHMLYSPACCFTEYIKENMEEFKDYFVE